MFRRSPRIALLLGVAFVALLLAGCRPNKQTAADLLADALVSYTWSNQDTSRIEKALCLLNKELQSENWIDDNHLSSEGVKVFDLDRQAVTKLSPIDDGDLNVINDTIQQITDGDMGVAGTLIEDAQNTPTADPALLAQAEAEFEIAFNATDPTEVIKHSERAWNYARLSLQ